MGDGGRKAPPEGLAPKPAAAPAHLVDAVRPEVRSGVADREPARCPESPEEREAALRHRPCLAPGDLLSALVGPLGG